MQESLPCIFEAGNLSEAGIDMCHLFADSASAALLTLLFYS